MEDMITNVTEATTDVAENVVDEVATAAPVASAGKNSFGAGFVTGILASVATWGIKKLWDKHQAKKALKPVEEPIDGEAEVVDEKDIKEV